MAEILCRLCANNCNDFRNLYDDNGDRTADTYGIAIKYFDISFLSVERGNRLPVMCLECWRQIIQFHNFQQSVYLAQRRLLENQQQVITQSTVDRNKDATNENHYDNIVVKVEEEIVSPLEVRANTVDHCPLMEATHNASSEPFYSYIVKEEVDYGCSPEMEYPAKIADCKDRRNTLNKNIFVTDEKELISLANTTDGVSFTKSLGKCETIMEILETTPVTTAVPEKDASIDEGDTSSSEDGNTSSNDETYVQSEDDVDDPTSSFTGEVFPADEELMDISESELESFDVYYSSDEDGVYVKECKHDVKPTVIVGKNKSALVKEVPSTSQKNIRTRILSKRLAIKREKRQLDKVSTFQPSSVVADTCQKDMQTRIFSKRLAIKRERRKLDKVPTFESGTSKKVQPRKPKNQRIKNEKTQISKNKSIKNEKCPMGPIGKSNIFQDDEPKKNVPKSRPIKSKREEELDDVIAQWKPNLECMICKNSYKTYTLLREHYRENHPSEEFYVLCCEIKIKKRGHLAEHIRLHIDPRAFKCAFCDKSCTRKRNLRLHMLKKHGITNGGGDVSLTFSSSKKQQNITRKKMKDSDEFIAQWLPNLECVVCKLTCSSFTSLQEHFRMQHRDMECYILCCEYKLFQREDVAEHLRQYTHPRAFKCQLCNKCFTMKSTLDYHTRMEHTATITNKGNFSQDDDSNDISITECNLGNASKNQLPRTMAAQKSDDFIAKWMPNMDCDLCSESCSSFTLLQTHFRQNHPKDKVYVLCCENKYSRREKLQEHIRSHIYPKGFKCELCGKRYSREAGLQNHVSKQHYIAAVNDCQDNTKVSLNDSLDDYPEEFDFMDKSIKRKTIRELDDIIAQWRPNLECAVCNETCSTFTLLQNHFRQKHPNVECYVSCCQCKFPGRYDVEEHIRFHKDPNAFKCEQCGRCFSRRRALNGHMRTHRPQQESLIK